MPSKIILPPELQHQILIDHQHHSFTQAELAAKYGLSRNVINRFIREKLGSYYRVFSPQPAVDEGTSHAIRYLFKKEKNPKTGLKYTRTELAKKFKISLPTVARILNKSRKCDWRAFNAEQREIQRKKDRKYRIKWRATHPHQPPQSSPVTTPAHIKKTRQPANAEPPHQPPQSSPVPTPASIKKTRQRAPRWRVSRKVALNILHAASHHMPKQLVLENFKISENLYNLIIKHPQEIKKNIPIP